MKAINLQLSKSDIDKHGRVLIPASLRRALHYNPGDTLVMRVINGELRIVSIKQMINSTQELIKANSRGGKSSMVDLFLQEKYVEAEKENELLK